VAAVVLVAFGIAAIALGANGLSTVHTSIEQQKIKGDSKMTPTEVKSAFAAAGLSTKGVRSPDLLGFPAWRSRTVPAGTLLCWLHAHGCS